MSEQSAAEQDNDPTEETLSIVSMATQTGRAACRVSQQRVMRHWSTCCPDMARFPRWADRALRKARHVADRK